MTGDPLESAVEARVGLRFDRAMRHRLERHVREAARQRGIEPAAYTELVRHDESVRQELVNTLVVPTTSFFRHPEQFEALGSLLPRWSDQVTIWSAGCSIGLEPYSVAMALAECGRPDWRVVASDVSSAALERVAAAVYEPRELAGLSAARRERYLERVGSRSRVVSALRDRVTAVAHNLATDAVPREARSARAVFCRNVLIYQRPELQRAVLDRVADQVAGLDVLFLGATESLWGVTERFQPVRVGDAYAYQRTGRPAAAEPPARRPRAPAAPSVPAIRTAPAVRAAPAGPGAAKPRDAAGHLGDGQVALAAGQHGAAVAAFRRACYLDPDNPLSQLNLGLALDAAGHAPEARQAFATARAALRQRSLALVEAELEGFRGEELLDLIERRLGRP